MESSLYRKILNGVIGQAIALPTIHHDDTWRLSAITFAIHLYDCCPLFEDLASRWELDLPYEEAADVDFTQTINELHTALFDIDYINIGNDSALGKQLSDKDYTVAMAMAKQYLGGVLPISDFLTFLKDKDSDISQMVKQAGEQFCSILSRIKSICSHASSDLFECLFDDVCAFYKCDYSNNDNPHLSIEDEDYEDWIATKSIQKRPTAILSLISKIDDKIKRASCWTETWEENYIPKSGCIDKEGLGRFIFSKRYKFYNKDFQSEKEEEDNDICHILTLIAEERFLRHQLRLFKGEKEDVDDRQFVPTTAVFSKKNFIDDLRISLCYQGLVRCKWIKDENPDNFVDLFDSTPNSCKITWNSTVGVGNLQKLFRTLIDKDYISVPESYTRDTILQSHFVDSSGQFINLRGAKATKKANDLILFCIQCLEGKIDPKHIPSAFDSALE